MDEGTETTHTVENDGITATKTVENDGSIRLEVRSNREGTVTVRVTDPTLDSHAGESIQFHAEHDRDWQTDEISIFKRAFDPGEQRTVRYRISGADPETLDSAPTLSVTEGRGVGGIVDRSRSDALRELAGGERDSLKTETATADSTSDPAVEPDGTATADTHSVDTSNGGAAAEADEGTETEEPAEATVEQASDTDASTAETAAIDDETATAEGESETLVPTENVARTLLSELREDRVDEEVTDALRSELGADKSRSQEIRIEHLQSEVSDLSAYGDTIESFIDRHGTFESVFEDVHTQLSTLDDRTERVESAVEDLSGTVDRVDDLDGEIGQVRSAQSELESDIEAIRETQTNLESRVDRLDEELADVHGRLDEELADVHGRLDDLELFSERITEALRGLGGGDPDA